jgi:tetratricopeptide (TPR) repeat protein
MTGSKPPTYWDTIRRARLIRVLAVYLGASFVVIQLVDIFTDQLGLPDWFFPSAVALLLIGLPVVVATALAQSAPGRAPAVPAPDPAAPRELLPETTAGAMATTKHWLTWRQAMVGGLLAFAVWGIAVAGYMTMRALGIGPVGSLVAAGVLDPHDRIVLADFETRTGDTLLAAAVTEAFRIDLAQSPLVSLADPAYVRQVLARMQRRPDEPLDPQLAREVAVRQGLKAVIAGEINPVGTGLVLSARLITAEDGTSLAAYRETAEDSTAIISAIDRLSKRMRARIGESLKTIRSNEPLNLVTTGSLQALRRYSQAVRALETEGDATKGIALLEEAIALDTAFAMAWRKLGVAWSNTGVNPTRGVRALQKAFEYRERLTDRERYYLLGTYYMQVTGEQEKAISAYRTLLDIYPDHGGALNNLSLVYGELRDYTRAEELLRRTIELDSANALGYGNVAAAQVALGKFDEAELTLERFGAKVPGHPDVAFFSAHLASARGDYEEAESSIRASLEASRGAPFVMLRSTFVLFGLQMMHGKLAAAERQARGAMDAAASVGIGAVNLQIAIQLALSDVWLRGDVGRALRRVEAALERTPLETIEPLNRPYLELAALYAVAERPEKAQATLAEADSAIAPELRRGAMAEQQRHLALGFIELAMGRTEEAIAEFRRGDEGPCLICSLPALGLAYERAGEADSALAVYERYVNTPLMFRVYSDMCYLPAAYERLGALHEQRGNRAMAISYYGKFAELWKDADPEFQPRVEAARRAIEALALDR